MMKIMIRQNSIKEMVKGAPNDTQHKNNAPPKKNKKTTTTKKQKQKTNKKQTNKQTKKQNSPIDCDGVQLTNAQCDVDTYTDKTKVLH